MICSTPQTGFEMSRRVLFTALVLVAIVAGATTRAQKAATRAAVDARIATALERNHIPGAVALAVNKSRTLYRTALGVADLSTRRPMTADAIFRIASMTKPVTSVAALQLIERGRISLDAPVSKYLPELSGLSVFESFDSASGAYTVRPVRRPITLRNLLTHTSGLGLQLHERDSAGFQAARWGTVFSWPASLRAWGTVALRDEHRLGWKAG